MNLKRHVGALAAAVLLGSGLIGCAVEDERPVPYEPQVTHTPKPKKTDDADDGLDENGTAEPGSEVEALEPPPIPDAIYEETLEGAEAAARYYLEAFEYGYASLDTEPLKYICNGSETCEFHQELIDKYRDRNQHVVGGDITVAAVENLIAVEKGAAVDLAVEQLPSTLYESDGAVVDTEDATEVIMNFLIEYINGRWQVTALGVG